MTGNGLGGRRRVIAALIVVSFLGGTWLLVGSRSDRAENSADPYRSIATPECVPSTLPAGQAHPSGEPEPLSPVWCYALGPMPITRQSGPNSWLDEFDTKINMGRLQDRDMNYRLFGNVEHHGSRTSAVFINNDHWMVDTADGSNGGVLLRPDRSFRFDQERMIIEADVAAAIPEYGDSASVEMIVTTAPEPTGKVVDLQYGYGAFGGHWTFGCRFQADRQMTCSLFNSSGSPGDPGVFGNELGRVWQMLPFQDVGRVNNGGRFDPGLEQSFRICGMNQLDLLCRDRFRLELVKDSVKIFVNGRLYFEQSGIDPRYQIPDEFLSSNVYVYFSSWVNRPLESAYRFHWDRLAINPRDESGIELPPSAAPSFGAAHRTHG